MKTTKEYLARPGHCPWCDSDRIEGQSVDIDNRYAYQQVSCLKCAAAWIDAYELIDFTLTQTPPAGPENLS